MQQGRIGGVALRSRVTSFVLPPTPAAPRQLAKKRSFNASLVITAGGSVHLFGGFGWQIHVLFSWKRSDTCIGRGSVVRRGNGFYKPTQPLCLCEQQQKFILRAQNNLWLIKYPQCLEIAQKSLVRNYPVAVKQPAAKCQTVVGLSRHKKACFATCQQRAEEQNSFLMFAPTVGTN